MMTSNGLIIDSPSDARTLLWLIAHPTSAEVEIPMFLIASQCQIGGSDADSGKIQK